MSDDKNLEKNFILEQYKIFCEIRDRYASRAFSTNKFYFVSLIVLVCLMTFYRDVKFISYFNVNIIFACVGIFTSILWWSNVDTYNILNKIKIAKVIEKIEEKLPIQAHKMEYDELQSYKKNKKAVIFSDVQKILALIFLLIFTAVFVHEIAYPILQAVYGPIEQFPAIDLKYGGK